jgi:hypothetical protein
MALHRNKRTTEKPMEYRTIAAPAPMECGGLTPLLRPLHDTLFCDSR